MLLDLSEDETAVLLRELDRIIAEDCYFFSDRIRTLREIRTKLRPDPVRPAPPPERRSMNRRGRLCGSADGTGERPEGQEPSLMTAVAQTGGLQIGKETDMARFRAPLSPEERARVLEIQDHLIERLVEREAAVADGQEDRVRELQEQINNLFAEKEEIEKWAVAGSA